MQRRKEYANRRCVEHVRTHVRTSRVGDSANRPVQMEQIVAHCPDEQISKLEILFILPIFESDTLQGIFDIFNVALLIINVGCTF